MKLECYANDQAAGKLYDSIGNMMKDDLLTYSMPNGISHINHFLQIVAWILVLLARTCICPFSEQKKLC
jgi:hypothetical protein